MLGFSPLSTTPLSTLPEAAGGGGPPTVTDLLTASFSFASATTQNTMCGVSSAATVTYTAQSATYTAAMLVSLLAASFNNTARAVSNTLLVKATVATLARVGQSVTPNLLSTATKATFAFTAKTVTSAVTVVIALTLAVFNLLSHALEVIYTPSTPPIAKWQTIRSIIRSVINSDD